MFISATKLVNVTRAVNGITTETKEEIMDVVVTVDAITLDNEGNASVTSKVTIGDVSFFGSVQTFVHDRSITTIYEQAYRALLKDESLIDPTIEN